MACMGRYCTVDKVKGKLGEDRIVITLNGTLAKREKRGMGEESAWKHSTSIPCVVRLLEGE